MFREPWTGSRERSSMSMKPSASNQDLWFAGTELSQVVEQGDYNPWQLQEERFKGGKQGWDS